MLQAGPLLISEFMAVNDGNPVNGSIADEDGDFSDWIEIYNPSDAPVDLDGWYLTDDQTNLTQWAFPDITLESNDYLLVFASDKDRRIAAEPLHTNFKLTGDGEYLGLVQPDGVTVAHAFAPFPEQSSGVSYGLLEDPTIVEQALGELSFLVPTVDDAAMPWTTAGFDDSAWNAADGGPTVLITEAGTGADFFEIQNVSETEVVTAGWFVAVDKGTVGGINVRHDTLWDLPDVMAPGEVIYVTDSSADVEHYFGEGISWSNGGNGWVLLVDGDGHAVDFVTWRYSQSQVAELDLKDLNGHDIAFDQVGWQGAGVPTTSEYTLRRVANIDHDDASDFEFVSAVDDYGKQNPELTLPFARETISGIGYSTPPEAFGGTPDTDVGEEMQGSQSSLWVRFPFEVADRDELDSLGLQMRYSDGFVAYVNGQEVARRNAPEVVEWNSAATDSRTVEEALAVEYLDISACLDVVETGTNTLAIHALSAGVDDAELWVHPELVGASIRRFEREFAMPTPGAANTAGYVVINEIHYDPEPTTDRTEFIELVNNTNMPLDISGWQLADGVEYTFPYGTSIPARGFLVVAETPAAIGQKFGVTALGPWFGRLENAGERILLRDASGRIQDEVTYKSTFPWPIAAQGEGSSMELIHPDLDNDLGGSWRPSGYSALLSGELIDLENSLQGKPTPGRRNSVWSVDEPPQIRQVDHTPNQPTTGDPETGAPITVTAKVTDFNGVADVSLSYQLVMPGSYIPAWLALDTTTLFGNPTKPFDPNPAFEDPANWTTVAMRDDGAGGDMVAGDHIYTGQIPAQATNRTLVRYRITATDRDNVSARVPHLDDPSLNFAVYVYDGVPDYTAATRSVLGTGHTYDSQLLESLPVYSLITDAADMNQCLGYNTSDRIPKSNERARDRFNWEATFVYDGVVYDHARYRLRQANDRYGGAGKRSMRIRFPKGNFLQARDNYGNAYPEKWRTLNTGKMFDNKDVGNFGLTETLNSQLWNMVGVPAPWMHTFHFRVVDGVEEAPAGVNGQYYGDFWGMFLAIEDYDPRFLQAHDLPDGNLYKLASSPEFVGKFWLGKVSELVI
ncbi:MAG TPA: lamin tail domain-containing protein [Thermoguttaceae bacterium]|nr:lamin tail domain-containing protein [Thermoguttaceae bacterium]